MQAVQLVGMGSAQMCQRTRCPLARHGAAHFEGAAGEGYHENGGQGEGYEQAAPREMSGGQRPVDENQREGQVEEHGRHQPRAVPPVPDGGVARRARQAP